MEDAQLDEMAAEQAPRPPVGLAGKAAAFVFLSVFAYYMLQWALEGAIHSRKAVVTPDLKGRSANAALDMLSPLHLGLTKVGTEFDSSVPIASILRQDPQPGSLAREGKIIKVVISQGGETVLAPTLAGLPLRNAEMLLRDSRLSLGQVSEAYSLTLDRGMVLSQDPAAESSVPTGSPINLAVSEGPPPSGVLLMPDLRRKDVKEAQKWAQSSGIAMSIEKDPNSLFPYGVILSQSPMPDTILSAEARVSLMVSGHSESGTFSSSRMFHYELSQGSSESLVRIVVVDKYGEREVFNGLRPPGSKIDVPLEEVGGARVKIYLNGILVEERDI